MLVRPKTPWRDGTSHIALEPQDLLEKLAALISRPYVNLIDYHGVLAPNAKSRWEVVGSGRSKAASAPMKFTGRMGTSETGFLSGLGVIPTAV